MAIARDAHTGTITTAASSITKSHTCTGSNLYLLVFINTNKFTDIMSGVTYAGTTMTLVNSVINVATLGSIYCYGLTNPTTGANNIVATFTGGTATLGIVGNSYTGCNQPVNNLPDNKTTNTATSATSITTTLTTVANNCWTVLYSVDSNLDPTAGANTSLIFTPPGGGYGLFDSNGVITPAGSTSLIANDGSANWVTSMVSLAPPQVAATNSNFLAFM